jgi:hypothetical protein
MRNTGQLSVEVHYFPISANELAERGHTLRTLLLRGARRSIQENVERNREIGTPEEARALTLDVVEK